MTDRTLNALRRKLEQWELAHLRQHCTELAERLERAEARAADAEYLAESWRENAFQLQRDLMDDGVQIGITQDGAMFSLPPDGPSDAPVTNASAEAPATPPDQDNALFIFDDIEDLNQDQPDPPAPPDPEPSATQFPAECLKWYTPPVLANETTLKLSSPDNWPLKVLCDDGEPLCGQSNGRHTITSQRPLAGWFPIVLRVPQTIRHQEPTCAN